LTAQIMVIGYTCPICRNRVPVLRSTDPPTKLPVEVISECPCGFIRKIPLETIQALEVWTEPSI